MQKTEIVCPKCGATFVPPVSKPKRSRPEAEVKAPTPAPIKAKAEAVRLKAEEKANAPPSWREKSFGLREKSVGLCYVC